ncbi:23S rRNA (adenine(2030)-N(6))-methyltransferase RlmJ [Arenimonas fontis]|uniref:Ribosomal RNA large subunit methyltransferase J n=1 Tax=Arenimonas fontis TaxID=2608255 RepID=A0A5B2ZA96_9GAMM|nr:23S rRNA (adenine(2030)-N(6))-methyltransferase RlmJ [Arenimonas fontis]KAA2285588.1 23S rRNA (adenine(2030)-N(6))-methyltransferase RlmJ [Arenimonas fontis]
MNYRHGFHAGNHADVLKHLVLLALLDALRGKDAPYFVLDTHAGRGNYPLAAEPAQRTGEAAGGILRLQAAAPDGPPALRRYLEAVAAAQSESPGDYPGSPRLVAAALRADDRLAACELQPEEAAALKACLAGDRRCHVHRRDGYAAVKALLPPREGERRIGRALVLIDPPYEAQEAEYPKVLKALREGLARMPQAQFAVWYPIKRRAALAPFLREAARMPVRSLLVAELLVRPDDSPLRMNGSGMLLVNPPWRFDERIAPALPALVRLLGENGAGSRLEWIRREPG